MGFTRHFTFFLYFYMHSFDIFLPKVKFSWMYLSTMHILWDRPSQYDVLLIIHATKVISKSLVYDSWLQMTFVAFMMSKTSYWHGLLTGYLHCLTFEHFKNLENLGDLENLENLKNLDNGVFWTFWELNCSFRSILSSDLGLNPLESCSTW